MKSKYIILWLLIPLSEIKAIFYDSNLKVSWYLFNDNPRFLCNVVEDYANIVIFGVIMFYLAFVKTDILIKQTALFLFILNCLDLIHLGLMDMWGFLVVKLFLTFILFFLCKKYIK